MKYLTLVDGLRRWRSAISASSGAGDASKLVATNAAGKIDNSFTDLQIVSGLAFLDLAAMTGLPGNYNDADYVMALPHFGNTTGTTTYTLKNGGVNGTVIATITLNFSASGQLISYAIA